MDDISKSTSQGFILSEMEGGLGLTLLWVGMHQVRAHDVVTDFLLLWVGMNQVRAHDVVTDFLLLRSPGLNAECHASNRTITPRPSTVHRTLRSALAQKNPRAMLLSCTGSCTRNGVFCLLSTPLHSG